MRVLIVKGLGVGEIVNALPVLDYLKQASPGVEIDWVVEEPFRELLEGNPHLAELHTVRSKRWRGRPLARDTWREVAQLKELLRSREYDLVFDLQGDLESGMICWLTGSVNRIGFEKCDLQQSANALFTMRRIPVRRQDYHVTDKYLRMVSVPFAKDFRQMQLSSTIRTSPEDDADAVALLATLSDGLVFLFHTAASRQTDLWTEKRWTELGRALMERFPDANILLDWSEEAERTVVTRISTGIGAGSRVLNRYSLKALSALLKRVDLVVGGDAGPVHLAAALGTPTVSFYRAGDGKGSGPRGKRHVVIQSPIHCTRCARTSCDKDLQCRDTIKMETVWAGVEDLLNEPS